MILCDRTLREMLPQFVAEPDYTLVNPASVDLRIGRDLLFEIDRPSAVVAGASAGAR